MNRILVNRGDGPSLNIDTLSDLRQIKSLFSEKPRKGCSHVALSVTDDGVIAKIYCPECKIQGFRVIERVRFLRAGLMVAVRIAVISLKSVVGQINAHDRKFLRAL